jgi:hypothetical protein
MMVGVVACRSPQTERGHRGNAPDPEPPALASARHEDRDSSSYSDNDERNPVMNPSPETIELNVNRFLRSRLESVSGAGGSDYTSIASLGALDPRVRADSSSWSQRFFVRGASPHDALPPARVSVHFRPDRVRYEYAVAGTAIVVIEGRHFALVKVDYANIPRLLRMDGSEQLREVNRVGMSLIGVADGWKPRKPSSPDEEIAFSTHPGVNLMTMSSWDRRVEAGVYRKELYFLCHKKEGQFVGFEGGGDWFSDDFRAQRAPGAR